MNMKKIVAVAIASVMAVSSMAIAASAEALTSKTGNAESAVIYEIEKDDLTDEQVSSIAKIEADVSVTSDMVNGCIGYNNAAGTWTSVNQETKEEGETNLKDTWVAELGEGGIQNADVLAQVQLWWVNPTYDEAGTETGDGTAEITYVGLFDKDGNVIKEYGSRASAADPDPAPADPDPAPADPTPADPTPGNNDGDGKDPANTGIEGVAVVAGLAVLAAGALVVAKKRK